MWPNSKAHGSQGAWEWTRSFSRSDLPAKQKGREKNAGIRHPEPLLLFSAPSERQRSIICVNLKIKINSGFLQPKPREHFVYVHFLHTCRHEVDR